MASSGTGTVAGDTTLSTPFLDAYFGCNAEQRQEVRNALKVLATITGQETAGIMLNALRWADGDWIAERGRLERQGVEPEEARDKATEAIRLEAARKLLELRTLIDSKEAADLN